MVSNDELMDFLVAWRAEWRRDKAAQQQNKTPWQVRAAVREKSIREIAQATGLGPTMAAATKLVLILTGTHPPPADCARAVQLLQEGDECPTSARQIYRIISGKK